MHGDMKESGFDPIPIEYIVNLIFQNFVKTHCKLFIFNTSLFFCLKTEIHLTYLKVCIT